ncbi:hypothetical protein ACGF0D_28740 [Kitasatospora sp. NPDC048298]|uniref:hypothetical protein n=1 Tax=Kitasatospora sp. NPDC048298 TaxID=3364049 RepID=UPI00371FB838
MPIRLLAALLLGLFSLLPVGCAQQHFDARQFHPAGVTVPVDPHDSSPGSPELHCAVGEAAVPTQRPSRSVRSVCVPAPCPFAVSGDGRAALPARHPEAAVGRAARAPGPRGPLLVTGRWRI